MLKANAPKWLIVLAFFNVYFIWGATYLAILYGLAGLPPFIMSFMRYITAGVLLVAGCILKGESMPPLKDLINHSIAGTVMLVGGSAMIAWAEQHITSGQAATLIATEPFWFVLLDKKSWSSYFSNKFVITGLVIGFLGIVLFFQNSATANTISNGHFQLVASCILLCSALLWVIASLFIKNRSGAGSIVMNTGVQLVAAGCFSALVSLFTGEWSNFSFLAVPLKAWEALLFLIVMGSLVAYLSFVWLISVRPPALVSTHTYVNPVVAVILGWLFANETLSVGQIISLFVILTGILLINISSYRLASAKKYR